MTEMISEATDIEAEIQKARERLAALNQRRGELALDARTNPAVEPELAQVRGEIAEAARALEELELARAAALEKDQAAAVAAREAAVRKLAEMLEDFDRAYEKLLAEISEGGTDPSILGEVDVLSRQVSSLGHDLAAATGRREYQRPWNLRGLLVAGGWAPDRVRVLLPSLFPGGAKPVVPRPWSSLLNDLESLDSQLKASD
jgi:DNA repair exonuclease SbcCD ATPase subunit